MRRVVRAGTRRVRGGQAGVIKHRDEELAVATEAFQAVVARAITSALEQACVEGLPGYPATRDG